MPTAEHRARAHAPALDAATIALPAALKRATPRLRKRFAPLVAAVAHHVDTLRRLRERVNP